MAGIEAGVLAEFYARLDEHPDVPLAVVKRLRSVLAAERLPKAEDLAALYLAESGDRIA